MFFPHAPKSRGLVLLVGEKGQTQHCQYRSKTIGDESKECRRCLNQNKGKHMLCKSTKAKPINANQPQIKNIGDKLQTNKIVMKYKSKSIVTKPKPKTEDHFKKPCQES